MMCMECKGKGRIEKKFNYVTPEFKDATTTVGWNCTKCSGTGKLNGGLVGEIRSAMGMDETIIPKWTVVYRCGKCGASYPDAASHECNTVPQLNAGKTPHKCPVCYGKGKVPDGFYNPSPNPYGGVSAGLYGEVCKACSGSGVLWS